MVLGQKHRGTVMDFLEMVEWQKPTDRETVRVRFAIEQKKDVENQRDERREHSYVQATD